MEHRPEEFSVGIRWSRADVPGFRVTMGWSNEGEAFLPIDRLRIPRGADLAAILGALDVAFNMDGGSVRELAAAHDAAARVHAKSLRAKVETLRRQLAEAEAAVSDIEHSV
jgi:hypothetical protein